MKGKVAVLGGADFVMPFSALGFDTFTTSDDTEETVVSAEKIAEGGYALVVVSENIAELVDDAFSNIQTLPMPCVIVVPFTTESKGFATQALGDVLKMATGIDILQGN